MNSEPVNHFDAVADAGPRRLTIYYIAALSTVALLAVVGQWLVQSQLGVQLNDSKIVNLAGRQRMLSQRLCKCAALLESDLNRPARDRQLAELRELLPVWRRSQQGLQHGDGELGLPANESPAAAEAFARLAPTFEAMQSTAERLVAEHDTLESSSSIATKSRMTALLEHESEYLAAMDEIVSIYERESHERVARLLRLERVLLVLTLVVLLAEGVLVFRPAARRIAASIFALRQAGEQLRAAKDAAESASRAKSDFLAKISHELRTPLHAIFGATELLRASNPRLAGTEYADVLDDSSRMLSCLLNDLLDLSKIEADKIDLHPQPFHLRDFASRTISMFRAGAQAKGLDLQLRIDADVPEIIVTDSSRLRQVLANLLNNAVKFTDVGSVAMNVTTDLSRDGASIRFDVVDTGIGIRTEDQARVFEPFTQLSANDDAAKAVGAGLGLAISTRLVAMLGGKLTVTSEPGQGSAFCFAIVSLPTSSPADINAASTTVATRPERSLDILVADDATVGRRILEELLLMFGHRVESVASGDEAVAAFERRCFDIVLLDLRMPGIDGRTAAAAMRHIERTNGRRRTPIVALSADAYAPPTADYGLDDFDDYVTKPFSGEQLRRTLARHAVETKTRSVEAEIQPKSIDVCGARTTRTNRADLRVEAILARLRGKRELLDELVGLFLADGPRTLDELQGLARKSNFIDLHTAAHRLRGQLASFEEDQASKTVQRLEEACVRADAGAVERELALLAIMWPEVCSELKSLRTTTIGS